MIYHARAGKNLSTDSLDDRGPARIQLCVSADEPRAVHRDHDRRTAGHACLLKLPDATVTERIVLAASGVRAGAAVRPR